MHAANEVVTRAQLEALIDYVNDNEGTSDPAFGKEVEFFERNEFDSSIASHLFKFFEMKVNGFQSPLAIEFPGGLNDKNGRDADYVFSVAVQLRNYFREKFGKPPLNKNVTRSFTIGGPPFPHAGRRLHRTESMLDRQYDVSQEQIAAAAQHVRDRYPEIIPYIRDLNDLAPRQGYKHYDVQGNGVPWIYVGEGLLATLPLSMERYNGSPDDAVLRLLRGDILDSKS
jgi:hypothetical protein